MRDLRRFVGFGEDDMAAVRRTAPVVLAHEAHLTAAVYEHFLSHPAAAVFFLKGDGTPDIDRLERRKHSLGRWLREAATASLDEGRAYGLMGTGFAHSHRSHGPGGAVPPELMVGAMSLVQTALAQLFAREMKDPREALAASLAWNKLLLLHLAVLLLGYTQPWRDEQARPPHPPA